MISSDDAPSSPRKEQVRRAEAQWHALLETFERGDLCVKQFCAEQELRVSSFHFWRNKRRAVAAKRFVPLAAPTAVPLGCEIELSLGDGMTLRLRYG